MRHFIKRSGDDSGILNPEVTPGQQLTDNTTPQSRSDLVSQAFITNMELADPSNMSQPAAVNPVLRGNIMGADSTDANRAPTDHMGDGTGQHDVLAAYDEGRAEALRKYAFQSVTGNHLPMGTMKTTSAPGTPQASIIKPPAPTMSQQVRDSGSSQGIAAAQTHANAFAGEQPIASPAPNINTALLAKPTTGPGAQPEQPKQAAVDGEYSGGTRSDYGKKEPTRYSIPPDNGQNYSPRTNLDMQPARQLNKAFNDLNAQRNADSLNEAGQASIGVMGH